MRPAAHGRGQPSKEDTMRILAAYDGSIDAQEAIDHAARLVPGAEATVLTVWEPIQITLTRTGGVGVGALYPHQGKSQRGSEKTARGCAPQGAQRGQAPRPGPP